MAADTGKPAAASAEDSGIRTEEKPQTPEPASKPEPAPKNPKRTTRRKKVTTASKPKTPNNVKDTPADFPGINVDEPEASDPRGDDPARKEARLKAQPVTYGKDESAQAAVILLSLLDGIAGLLAGDDARMTPAEKGMIEPPLTRMLEKMDIAVVGQVAAFSDPIMLLMGLIAWASRVARIVREKNPPEPEPELNPVEYSGNGNGRPVSNFTPSSNKSAILAEQMIGPQSLHDQFASEEINLE